MQGKYTFVYTNAIFFGQTWLPLRSQTVTTQLFSKLGVVKSSLAGLAMMRVLLPCTRFQDV